MQDGQIPLMAAIEAGNLNVCRELLGYETAAQIKQVDYCTDEINAMTHFERHNRNLATFKLNTIQ